MVKFGSTFVYNEPQAALEGDDVFLAGPIYEGYSPPLYVLKRTKLTYSLRCPLAPPPLHWSQQLSPSTEIAPQILFILVMCIYC